MSLREELRIEAETEIAAEALKDRSEVGVSCVVKNLFNATGRLRGYQVTVKTDNGFSKTFASVATASEPDGLALVAEHQDDVVTEIRRRRTLRKATR